MYLVDQAVALLLGGVGVGGDGDRADRREGQPRQQVWRRGPGGDDDQVTAPDPGLPQPRGQVGDLTGCVRERQRAVVGADPRPVRIARGRVEDQARDRARGHPLNSLRSTAAAPTMAFILPTADSHGRYFMPQSVETTTFSGFT